MTVFLCGFISGEMEKPLVIGKAAKSRCFRKLDIWKLPVEWRSNKKAWMTSQIMEEWLTAYRKLLMQSLLANMDCTSSASELARSVSVRDAVIWISQAIKKLWEHPTSLLAAPNSTSFGRTAALLVASAKHQRSARCGPSCGIGQTSTQR